MDELDRVFQRLVHSIRQRHPDYMSMPFSVQELYEDLIPYRHHRRELGIETNQDYELVISRLLSGERGYLRGDLGMQEKLSENLQQKVPDTGAFRDYANSKVSISPEAIAAIGADSTARKKTPTAPSPAVEAGKATTEGAGAAAPAATAPPLSDVASPTAEKCKFCGHSLPEGRAITYCPHCGQNLTIKNCPACGTELENDWRFCITCGRSVI